MGGGTLGSGPGAALAGALRFRSPDLALLAGETTGAGPEDLEGCWQLVVRLGGDLVFPALRAAGERRLKVEGLPAAGLSPAAPTSCTAEEAGKFWLRGWEPPCLGALAGGGQWLANL